MDPLGGLGLRSKVWLKWPVDLEDPWVPEGCRIGTFRFWGIVQHLYRLIGGICAGGVDPQPPTVLPKTSCRLLEAAVRWFYAPETNRKLTWKPKKGPCKDYSPSKRGLYGFPC